VPPRVLALFAKAPIPGEVKTRLCPPLSPVRAAELYSAMLLDILDQDAQRRDVDLALWYSPPTAFPWFADHVPPRYRLLPQTQGNLGARMANLFRVHGSEGYRRIVLRGTDSPTLPPERVAEALDALERAELVLCPDLDGGYNLIGLRWPCDALFSMELGHASVLEQTLARARAAGLSFELLPPHHDVDRPEDLERLEASLSEALTPRTLRWLRCASELSTRVSS
jgi:hypothetical protein